jgi:SAM-dependent methyltransferase
MHRHNEEEMIRILLSPERAKFEDPSKFIPKLLRGGEVVAELGCGPGYYCRELIKLASTLYCVDRSSKSLEFVRKLNGAIVLNEDSSKTSIPPNSIDIVLLADSFHDMDREATYMEVLRILKGDGKVIVVDWRKDAPMGPPPSLRMSKEDYIKQFRDFLLETEFDVGPYHYGLVFRRMKPEFN